jgi:hypothetical protein
MASGRFQLFYKDRDVDFPCIGVHYQVVTDADGKFRIRAAARLCWGLGAKGALEFTVNGAKVLQFAKWVSYQLLNSGFRAMAGDPGSSLA